MLLLHGLLCLAGFAALAAGLGCRLVLWLRLRPKGAAEGIVVMTGLGAGALQAVPILLLATGLGTATGFRVTLAILSLLLLPDMVRFGRSALRLAHTLRRTTGWERALAAIFFVLLCAILVRTVCPTVDGDALSYHLAAAKRFLQAGRFVFLPSITHSNWPLGIESLYTMLQAVAPGAPVAVVQFLLGLVTLGTLWLLARRLGGRFSAAVAVVLLLADNGIWQEMTMAYVDLGTTTFATLAVYALVRERQGGDKGSAWLTVAAIFAGLAATSKLNGVWVVVAGTLVVLTTGPAEGTARLRRALRFALIGGAVVAPWFIRTWVVTGNPLYPALYGLFGGREWTPTGFTHLHEFYLRLNVPPGMPPTPEVLRWSHMALAAVGIGNGLLVFRFTRDSRVALPARFAAAFIALMCTFSILNLRFMMAALPCIVLCIAVRFKKASALNAAILVLLAAVLAFRLGNRKLDPDLRTALAVATGSKSAAEYQRDGVLDYDVVQYANRHLPPTARIAVSELAVDAALYDAATYWTDFWMQDSIHYDSQERLAGDLRRLGITHLVIQTELPPWCDSSHACYSRNHIERPMLLEFAQRNGKLLFVSRQVALYEIRP